MSLRTLILLATAVAAVPLPAEPQTSETAIHGVLTAQVQAWNRGDIPAFVTTYAENCIFVGKQMLEGRSNLLARYRKAYPSSAAMGRLAFRNLRIRELDEHVATAVGEWHIDRAASSGGPVGGVFSLVLQLNGRTWEIVLDHTS